MFIDVTRYGGIRLMRLAVGAIAYLDACEGGTSVHILGGETLRVNEDPETIELRCMCAADEIVPSPAPPAESELPPVPAKPKRSGQK